MAIIKKIAENNGSSWELNDIGVDAKNVDLDPRVVGQNNVQSVLSNLFGTNVYTADRVLVTSATNSISTHNITTTELGYLSGVTSNIQQQIDNISESYGDVINLLYPIGCYFETSNSDFNPNRSWQGTVWELEASGLVHVSADETDGGKYPVNSRGGSEQISYTPSGSNAGTKLTVNEMPVHNHTFKGTEIKNLKTGNQSANHTHKITTKGSEYNNTPTQKAWGGLVGTTDGPSHIIFGGNVLTASGATNSHEFTSTTNSANHNHTVNNFTPAGSIENNGKGNAHTHTFTGTATNINVMQPYIAVYKWHRIA